MNITNYPKVLVCCKALWVCLSFDLGMLSFCSPGRCSGSLKTSDYHYIQGEHILHMSVVSLFSQAWQLVEL